MTSSDVYSYYTIVDDYGLTNFTTVRKVDTRDNGTRSDFNYRVAEL